MRVWLVILLSWFYHRTARAVDTVCLQFLSSWLLPLILLLVWVTVPMCRPLHLAIRARPVNARGPLAGRSSPTIQRPIRDLHQYTQKNEGNQVVDNTYCEDGWVSFCDGSITSPSCLSHLKRKIKSFLTLKEATLLSDRFETFDAYRFDKP